MGWGHSGTRIRKGSRLDLTDRERLKNFHAGQNLICSPHGLYLKARFFDSKNFDILKENKHKQEKGRSQFIIHLARSILALLVRGE